MRIVGGHIMASLIGVSLYKLFNLLSAEMFERLHWLLCALAVSLSLFAMQLTHTVHPPASATALISVTGGKIIYDLGYWYVLCPTGLGIAIMMVVAMLMNNVARRYPTHWWNPKTKKIVVVDQDMSTTIADFVSPESGDDESGDVTSQTDTAVPTASHSANDLATQTRPHHHHHYPHGHIGVYYGGEHHQELKDHEKMVEEHAHGDLEHGFKRSSILVEKHGSPRIGTCEDDHLATIEQLQRRIHELEEQLASVAK